MLQRNFKKHHELGISPQLYDGLYQVLRAFERGELVWTPHNIPRPNGFNMSWEWVEYKCGTVGCILGWAEHFCGVPGAYYRERNVELDKLYHPGLKLKDITIEQAEHALRSYLATGHADWETAREME